MRTPPTTPEWDVIPRPCQSHADAERQAWARDMQTYDDEHGDARDARADRSER